jgi:glycosyltransferase involved in cell wall biosynthesis
MVSVIIPVYNEEKYISQCLESIINQDCPENSFEIICIDGFSTDKTRLIIEGFVEKYPNIRLLDNPNKFVSDALNTGIKASYGDVIIRVDAHCTYPQHYIKVLASMLKELNADNVGGMWNTLPACDSPICKAIAVASSTGFGVGNSLHKTGTDKIIKTDTVPFGCFRRDIFDRLGFFDPDLIRNQDDEFNGRIIKNGGKIFLIPDVVINYFARDSLIKMSQMYYQYGLFKPLVNKKLGSPATCRQLVPPLFVTVVILGSVFSLILPVTLPFLTGMIGLYFLTSLMVSTKKALKYRSVPFIILLPLVFIIIHLSYGMGYLTGIFKFIIIGSNSVNAKVNH